MVDMKKKTKRLITYTVLFLLVLFSFVLIWQLGLVQFSIPPEWTRGSMGCSQIDTDLWECTFFCSLNMGYGGSDGCYYPESEFPGYTIHDSRLYDVNPDCARSGLNFNPDYPTKRDGYYMMSVVWDRNHCQPGAVSLKVESIWRKGTTTTTTIRVYPDGEGTFILLLIVVLFVVLMISLFYLKIIKL